MATGRRRVDARTRAFGIATGATIAALLLVLFADLPWWAWMLIVVLGLLVAIGFSARRVGPRRP